MSEFENLIKSGKILVVNLPSKRKEIFDNQLLLLKDDLSNAAILLLNRKVRGALIHAFNALERAVDMFLILKGIKVHDRYSREVAIGNKIGKEFLGKFKELYELRRNTMYEREIASEETVNKILEEMLPQIVDLINRELPNKEKINVK